MGNHKPGELALQYGNDFWRHAIDKFKQNLGCPQKYEDPRELWSAVEDYMEYTSERYVEREDYVGKDAIKVQRKTAVPFTKESFCLFLGITTHTFDNYRDRHKTTEGKSEKERQIDELFFTICSFIEDTIFAQQYEGAATFKYNANLVARKLGIADKREVKSHETIKRINKVTVELPPGVEYRRIEDQESNVVD